MSNNTRFWIFALPVFFIVPSIVYWGLVTHFHFNLFHPDWLWPAYNQYFLSLLEGRVDVPVEAIGPEGLKYNDKVYMYYGILPAIIRGIIYPFVDLNTTPVSRFFVLLWSVGAVSVLQWVVIKKYLEGKRSTYRFSLLILISYVLWFGSVHLSIVQSASIYQEPYAASLFLLACYMALFSKDVLFKSKIDVLHLKSYSFLAALAVHARPSVAIFLYAITLVLIFFDFFIQFKSTERNRYHYFQLVRSFLNRAFIPLLILAVGGVLLLVINFIKYGNPFAIADGLYGYYLLEGSSLKFCGVRESGRFNVLRIFPHAIYYFTGDFQAFKSLSNMLGLGYASVGVPENRLIIAWVWPVMAFIFMVINLIKNMKSLSVRKILVGLVFIISISSAFLMLSYVTIAYRYAADIWLPFLLALLWLYQKCLKEENKIVGYFSGVWKTPVIALLLFLSAVSPLYTMSNYEIAYFAETRRSGIYGEFKKEVYLPHEKHIEVMNNPPNRLKYDHCIE